MGEPDRDPEWVEAVRRGLIDWYDRGHRDLPWRRERDPYRVLVSEMMLVQTTVAAVVPYYARFLERFPTVEALAGASESEVLKAWEGLGYYRRARQLHEAARAVVDQLGGVFPGDLEGLRALPGVGRYIAGAVRSFAFDLPAPILEANTQRVLARLLAWPDPVAASGSQKRFWEAAARLVPEEAPGRFNQAFMELGATVCGPKSPACLVCPIASNCRARREGLQDRLPVRVARPTASESSEVCGLVVRDGRLLMVRRGPGRLWEGFWEFPTVWAAGEDPAGRRDGVGEVDLAEGVRRLSGVIVGPPAGPDAEAAVVRYGVTRYRVTLKAIWLEDRGGEPTPGPGLIEAGWVEPSALSRLALAASTRRVARILGDRGTGPVPGP